MNLGQAKDKVIKIIREYSSSGTLITIGQNLDYTLPMPSFFDIAQKDIAKYKKITKKYSFTNNEIENLLGDTLKLYRHLDEDKTHESTEGGKSYYFEVDNIATIYIEEETSENTWTILETITNTTSSAFVAYKGNVTPSEASNSVRIRFSGSYVYNYKNVALYAYNYATDDDIPEYSEYITFEIPEKILSIKHIKYTRDYKKYSNLGNFSFERIGDIGYVKIQRELYGEFEVYYNKIPDTIEPNASDSTEFEVGEDAQNDMLYYVAHSVLSDENPYLSELFLQQYYTKVSGYDNADSTGTNQVVDVYGWC